LISDFRVVTWATAVIAVILTLVFTINLLRDKPRADQRLRIIEIISASALTVTAMALPLLIGTLIVLRSRPSPR